MSESSVEIIRTVPDRYETDVVGLPPMAMTLTNSERKSAYCDRRWLYKYGQQLGGRAGAALYRGRWIHQGLESMFEYFRVTRAALPKHWDEHCPLCEVNGHKDDCGVCGGSGLGILRMVEQTIAMDLEDAELRYGSTKMEFEAECDRICQAITGYINMWGEYPLGDWEVVCVEQSFAAPIVHPITGDTLVSDIPVVAHPRGWRLAAADERPDQIIRMPWFQIGKCDAVLQHRHNRQLLIHEFKTSANPKSYSRDLHLDTQLPGYIRLVDYARKQGFFGYDAGKIQGYQFDVLTSKGWSSPKILKSGKASTADRSCSSVPSWSWAEFLKREEVRKKHTDSEIQQMVMHSRAARDRVDSKLYCREFGTFSEADIQMFCWELLGDAERFARFRRIISQPNGEKLGDASRAFHFPKKPICRIAGHSCEFTGVCLSGSEGESFEKKELIVWHDKHAIEELKKEVQCPF